MDCTDFLTEFGLHWSADLATKIKSHILDQSLTAGRSATSAGIIIVFDLQQSKFRYSVKPTVILP